MSLQRDFSSSAVISGFVAVLITFTSSIAIIYQAAYAAGVSETEISSWVWAIGLGTAITSIGLSLGYRDPIMTAWSPAAAAMLITSASGVPLTEVIGAFVISGLLLMIFGFTGWFERALRYIPIALASGMLAGVLLKFGLNTFTTMETHFTLIAAMLATWLLARYWLPRYAIMLAFGMGIGVALLQGTIEFDRLHFSLTKPIFIFPQFSLTTFIGIALPLFVVVMASQNVTGAALLRTYNYQTPISPLIGWTGAANFLLAPFGAFSVNLGAMTAPMCLSPAAHEDKERRYIAAVAAGFFYLLAGLFAANLTALFGMLPKELVLAIAGIGLFSTIGNGLAAALTQEKDREAALVTFLVTASGLTLLGIGSAFWGLFAGLGVLGVRKLKKATEKIPTN